MNGAILPDGVGRKHFWILINYIQQEWERLPRIEWENVRGMNKYTWVSLVILTWRWGMSLTPKRVVLLTIYFYCIIYLKTQDYG